MADKLSPQILARYGDARIPRYTSYPSSPHFTREIGEDHYRSWLSSLPATPLSLYLHVPFCRAMCWYCGCHTTVASRAEPVSRYVDALMEEIRKVADVAGHGRPVAHLHFGGGTPTLMQAGQMRMVTDRLRDLFSIIPQAEMAIEIDPRTLTFEMAATLGGCGFNRASLGVQSFDLEVQRAINRLQSFAETEAAVRSLRANGVSGINLDLVYGLPGQTLQSCLTTVEQALALHPDRFAIFGYAHVPAFKPHQRKINEAQLPDAVDRHAQSQAIASALSMAGYSQVGMDHFALPGDPLASAAATGRLHRNFQGYTTDEAEVLLGFGASAIGRTPRGFVQNEIRIPEYQRLVAGGHLPIARGYRLAEDDRLRGRLIERLMCDHWVDVAAICRNFKTDPEEILQGARLDPFIADGLIELRGTDVIVKPHARPLVRSLAAAFDAHLDKESRYSRAV